jgi:hypothetical protein
MKKYIILASVLLAAHLQANTLIFTRGPVCCGMGTYLLNAVSTYNMNYASISHIDASRYVYYQAFNDFFPYDMEIIAKAIDADNISYAISDYHVYFKDMVYPEQKNDVLERLVLIRSILNDPLNERVKASLRSVVKHMVMMNVAYETACNNNVILEGGTILNIDEEVALFAHSFDSVIRVFAYVHPTEMISMWQERNEAAIANKQASQRRFLSDVLRTFFNSFTQAENPQDALVTLSRDEFGTIIGQAAEYINNVPAEEFGENGIFTRSEFTLAELAEFAETKYQQLGFDQQDTVYLVPSLPYDVALASPQECLDFAQSLNDLIQ